MSNKCSQVGTVYILKLDEPLGTNRHSAQFYIGWAANFLGRLWHHENGSGAAFTQAACRRGIGFKVVWQQSGTRTDERRIKQKKNTKRFLQQQGVQV